MITERNMDLTAESGRHQAITTEPDAHSMQRLRSVLSDKNINWHPWEEKNIPALSSKLRQAALFRRDKLDARLRGVAGSDFVGGILTAMQGHFYRPDMCDATMKAVAHDYLRLLDGYSEYVWRLANDRILLDKERSRFFPTVAELKEVLDGIVGSYSWEIRRLGILIEEA